MFSPGLIQALLYLMFFVARKVRLSLSVRPVLPLLVAVVGTQLLATLFAVDVVFLELIGVS